MNTKTIRLNLKVLYEKRGPCLSLGGMIQCSEDGRYHLIGESGSVIANNGDQFEVEHFADGLIRLSSKDTGRAVYLLRQEYNIAATTVTTAITKLQEDSVINKKEQEEELREYVVCIAEKLKEMADKLELEIKATDSLDEACGLLDEFCRVAEEIRN